MKSIFLVAVLILPIIISTFDGEQNFAISLTFSCHASTRMLLFFANPE